MVGTLKRCPFCDNAAQIRTKKALFTRCRHSVRCTHCEVETPAYFDVHFAIDTWNRRTQPNE
jgi:Lar family restriction alleviation protein